MPTTNDQHNNRKRTRGLASMQVANAVRPSAILASVQYCVAGGGFSGGPERFVQDEPWITRPSNMANCGKL